jgi:acetyltransferase-like isoleucine patch superfamily enzyme
VISARALAIVGSGPVFTMAHAIGVELRGIDQVVPIELSPDRIAEADVRALIGQSPGDVEIFVAIGVHALNHARADLCAKIAEAGYTTVNLIHPRAIVAHSAALASNVLVGAGASVGPNGVVGIGGVLLDGARIEAGARVGAFAWIGANVVVGFGSSVGAHTILRPGVNLDAGVPVGDHCELATPGLRQVAVPDCTFDTPAFKQPVRVYRGTTLASAPSFRSGGSA